jgi:hypothetical protein
MTKSVWSGMAQEVIYGSWRNINLERDEDYDGLLVWEEGDIRDDIDTFDELFSEYSCFSDDVVPVNEVARDELRTLWEDAGEGDS